MQKSQVGPLHRVHVATTVLLAVVNVLLIGQNLSMRRQLARPVSGEFLEVGDEVPPLEGIDGSGEVVALDYPRDALPTLLLFMSPSCRFCEELFPSWQDLIDKARANGHRVVAVVRADEATSAVERYLSKWEVAFLDVIYIPAEMIDAYGFYATPITLVVGAGGVVERNWIGMWDTAQFDAVNVYFGTSLAQEAG